MIARLFSLNGQVGKVLRYVEMDNGIVRRVGNLTKDASRAYSYGIKTPKQTVRITKPHYVNGKYLDVDQVVWERNRENGERALLIFQRFNKAGTSRMIRADNFADGKMKIEKIIKGKGSLFDSEILCLHKIYISILDEIINAKVGKLK